MQRWKRFRFLIFSIPIPIPIPLLQDDSDSDSDSNRTNVDSDSDSDSTDGLKFYFDSVFDSELDFVIVTKSILHAQVCLFMFVSILYTCNSNRTCEY